MRLPGGSLPPHRPGSIPVAHPSGSRKPARLPQFRSGHCTPPSASLVLPCASSLAGAPRVPAALPRRHSGDTPASTRCGSRKLLCLQPFLSFFCTRRAFFRLRCVFPPDRILLSGQRTRLAEAWPAPQLRSRGETGIPLFIRHGVAVLLRGGAETGSPQQLAGRAPVLWFDIQVSPLLSAPHVPHPVAAPATLTTGRKTAPRGGAKRAAQAPASLRCTNSAHIVVSFRSDAPSANHLLRSANGATKANTALRGRRLYSILGRECLVLNHNALPKVAVVAAQFSLCSQRGLLGLGAARVLVIGPQPAHQARRLLLRPLRIERHQPLLDFRVGQSRRPAVGRKAPRGRSALRPSIFLGVRAWF